MIKVLDHGHVRLVEHMGNDLSVVRNARVSYDAEWRAGEDEGSDTRLLNYLMKNRHTSPFEAVTFTFDLKMPIFLARQWHRHRTWAYNEVSARYTELPEEFYIPEPEFVGVQAKSNKQMRDLINNGEAEKFCAALKQASESCFKDYKTALDRGIPRELARCFLPLNTYTHFFGTVNLHNLFHFLRLRLHPHAQHEIRLYAKAIMTILDETVPVSSAAFRNHILGEI